jgi:hypothetical protein
LALLERLKGKSRFAEEKMNDRVMRWEVVQRKALLEAGKAPVLAVHQ